MAVNLVMNIKYFNIMLIIKSCMIVMSILKCINIYETKMIIDFKHFNVCC